MQYKQIILIRTDLDMRCGKKCVQVAHASMMAADKGNPLYVPSWKVEGMRKIVLKVKDLEQLLEIANKACEKDIQYAIVSDFGLTQLEPNTITCVGFVPLKEGTDKSTFLSELTKDLSLL